MTINESEMKFGPYSDDLCFYIEKSEVYAKIRQDVKIAEFLLLRSDKKSLAMWVVEAKSSTPRPETQPSFDGFIGDIRDKFINTFSLVWALILQRHRGVKDELSNRFKAVKLGELNVRFVLIIKEHRSEWLSPVKDALARALRSTIKTWGFNPNAVVVINEEMAKQYGLISS